jgi:hypothetical protein
MTKEASVTIQGLNLGKMTKKGGGCVEIQFKDKREVMGTLKVSRTKLEWFPPNAKKGYPILPSEFRDFVYKKYKIKKTRRRKSKSK